MCVWILALLLLTLVFTFVIFHMNRVILSELWWFWKCKTTLIRISSTDLMRLNCPHMCTSHFLHHVYNAQIVFKTLRFWPLVFPYITLECEWFHMRKVERNLKSFQREQVNILPPTFFDCLCSFGFWRKFLRSISCLLNPAIYTSKQEQQASTTHHYYSLMSCVFKETEIIQEPCG